MNEKILELAEQATIKSVSENFTGEKLEIITPSKEWAVKFAELLINECIGVVNKRYMGDLNREDMEVRRCVEDLKKHFGV